MQFLQIAAKSARLREAANAFIAEALKQKGLDDIQPCHGDLLAYVYQNPGIKITELAARTRRTKSTVSAMSDKLVRLGYLEKRPDPKDSRAVGLWALDKTQALRPVFEEISRQMNEKLSAGFTQEELERFEFFLDKARMNLLD